MALLSASEIRRVEAKHAVGIRSKEIVALFQRKGERFSEATLRKYVQLELLPKSRRVGSRGRHRGSSGLYPVSVVRMINEIKEALATGATLEEIRVGAVGLGGEVDMLERVSRQVFVRFGEAIQQQEDRTKKPKFKQALGKHRRMIEREIRALNKLAGKVGSGVRSTAGAPLR